MDRKKIVLTIIAVFGTVLVLLFGIGFTKSKSDEFTRMILPVARLECNGKIYYVDNKARSIYETSDKASASSKLLKNKINTSGIIMWKDSLYYITSPGSKLCSLKLDGGIVKEIDGCNIIMPYQPFFRLGNHLYYYNSQNVLSRIDNSGKIEVVSEIN